MPARTKPRDRLFLKTEMFDQLIHERGWVTNEEAARGLRIDPGVLWKLRSRKISQPSGLTVDAIVTGLGAPYTALFVRVEADRD